VSDLPLNIKSKVYRDPDRTIALCARVSRSRKPVSDLLKELSNFDRVISLLSRLYRMGHLSVFEHARFFLVTERNRRTEELVLLYRFLERTILSDKIMVSGNFRTLMEILEGPHDHLKEIVMEVLRSSSFLSRLYRLEGWMDLGATSPLEVAQYSSGDIQIFVINELDPGPEIEPEARRKHSAITLIVEGCSRVCTHQLVRHRTMSFTQQSQRYVPPNSDFVVPPSLRGRAECLAHLNKVFALYDNLVRGGVPYEDARFILPQGVKTRIAVTASGESLENFFRLRLTRDAQWEIRSLANLVLNALKELLPDVWGPFQVG